jgi:hypothetical protein
MHRRRLRFGKGFRVAIGNARSQAAEMVNPPGDAEGDGANRHRGAEHEIRNTGRTPLSTLNLYVPPAYSNRGNELPRAKP